jgi:hypothetical protein
VRVRAIVRELAAVACMVVLLLPRSGGSQPLGPGPNADGGPPFAETLPPGDIIASVRSAGFNPLSRPVQRGAVYVVFAVDRYFMDVRVMVDARSGRVLSATRLAGVMYGGPGYGGYEVVPGAPPGYLPPYGERPLRGAERPPVPPADVPLHGPGGNQINPSENPQPVDVAKRSMPPRPPLPRARPEIPDAAKEPAAQPQPPPAATAPAAAPPKPIAVQGEAAPKPPQQPAMIPVAPLEATAPATVPPSPGTTQGDAAPKSPPKSPQQPTMVPVAPLE